MQMDQRPRPAQARVRSLGDLLHGSRVERADLDDLADKLWFDREGRDAYVRFGVLLVLSVVIATGGVLTDSTATVIGAMIVAPLMTPIMAATLAIVAADAVRIGRSLVIVAVGVGVAIGLSYLMALVSPAVVSVANNSQVAGRVKPDLADLVVALGSGAAGAFALSRRNVSDALPGVAIAISLVPPLCVVGVMLANHAPHASAGAALLFLTNFLAILIAGGGSLALMGYGRAAFAEPVRGRRTAVVVISLATLVVIVPLAITGSRIAQDSIREYTVQGDASVALPESYTLVSVNADGNDIDVTIAGPPTSDYATTANELATAVHADYPTTTVRVTFVATDKVQVPPAT
jgi:uncharacterized hydrophobic protein (TIGR00271 family)